MEVAMHSLGGQSPGCEALEVSCPTAPTPLRPDHAKSWKQSLWFAAQWTLGGVPVHYGNLWRHPTALMDDNAVFRPLSETGQLPVKPTIHPGRARKGADQFPISPLYQPQRTPGEV